MSLQPLIAKARSYLPADEQGRIPSRLVVWAAVWCLVVLAASLAGYERLYSTFVEYDDEGYVLLTLKSFAAGHPLYDQTYSQYGPAFYILESAVHGATGLELSHDVARLKTLLLWLATAGLSALTVYRLTRSPLISLVGFAAAFLHLEKLALEPGHPQIWCLLGLTTAIFAGTLDSTKQTTWRVLLLAMATALVACIKLNLGVYLGMAVTLALLLGSQPNTLNRIFTYLSVAVAGMLPFVLLGGHLTEPGGLRLPLLVLTGLVGVLFAAERMPRTTERLELIGYIAASAVLAMSMLLWCVKNGTTLTGLVDGVLLQHGKFLERFYHAMPAPVWTPLWCVLACGLGFLARGGSVRAMRMCQLAALGLAIYLGVVHVLELTTPMEHGLVDRGGARLILAILAPLAWLVVWPHNANDLPGRARLLLALVATLMPVAVYPTPGAQMSFGSLPLLIALLVVLHDVSRMPALVGDGFGPLVRAGIVGLAALLGVALLSRDAYLTWQRAGYESLALPGAVRLRLPAEEAARWRWAAGKVREHGTTFVGLHHAQCSLYFWADLEPPTPINATFWSHLLNDEQQNRIVRSLKRNRHSSVFLNRDSTSHYDPAAPLAGYLLTHYERAETRGGMEIWRRKADSSAEPGVVTSAGHR